MFMKNVAGKAKLLGILALVLSLGACDQAMLEAQNAANGGENAAGPWEQYEVNTAPTVACLAPEYRGRFTCARDYTNSREAYFCQPNDPSLDLIPVQQAVDSFIHRTYGVLPMTPDGVTSNTKGPRASATLFSRASAETNWKSVRGLMVTSFDANLTFNADCLN